MPACVCTYRLVSFVFGTAQIGKIRHISEIPPSKAVNTHTSLKDRQGEPQWLQTKPLHTINASLVNEEDEKNQKLARRVIDFMLIGILKTRTRMNFVEQVTRGLVQGVRVFPRQRLVDDNVRWLHQRAVRIHGVKRMAEPKANNFNRFCMCWDDNF